MKGITKSIMLSHKTFKRSLLLVVVIICVFLAVIATHAQPPSNMFKTSENSPVIDHLNLIDDQRFIYEHVLVQRQMDTGPQTRENVIVEEPPHFPARIAGVVGEPPPVFFSVL